MTRYLTGLLALLFVLHAHAEAAADRFGPLFLQDSQRIVCGFTGMDYQRLIQLPSGTDVDTESLALPFWLILVPVIIQPCFTDCQYLGMLAQRTEGFDIRFLVIGILRMHTHRRENLFMRFGNGEDLRRFFQRDPDGHTAADIIDGHGSHYLGQAVGKAIKIQVTVGIDQLGHKIQADGS